MVLGQGDEDEDGSLGESASSAIPGLLHDVVDAIAVSMGDDNRQVIMPTIPFKIDAPPMRPYEKKRTLSIPLLLCIALRVRPCA